MPVVDELEVSMAWGLLVFDPCKRCSKMFCTYCNYQKIWNNLIFRLHCPSCISSKLFLRRSMGPEMKQIGINLLIKIEMMTVKCVRTKICSTYGFNAVFFCHAFFKVVTTLTNLSWLKYKVQCSLIFWKSMAERNSIKTVSTIRPVAGYFSEVRPWPVLPQNWGPANPYL